MGRQPGLTSKKTLDLKLRVHLSLSFRSPICKTGITLFLLILQIEAFISILQNA